MPSEILMEFIDDAREHLQSASRYILQLEKEPGGEDHLNGLLRNLHTIKGNAGFMDLGSLGGLYEMLHTAESILQVVRENRVGDCSQNLIDLMFRVLDTTEIMLNRLESDVDRPCDELIGLMKALEGWDPEECMKAASQAATEPETKPEPVPSAAEPEPAPDPEPEPPAAEPEPAPDPEPEPPAAEPEPAPVPVPERELGLDGLLDEMVRWTSGGADEGCILDLHEIEQRLEPIQKRIEAECGPNAAHAFWLIEEYIGECAFNERNIPAGDESLFYGLLENLAARLDLPVSATPIEIMKLDGADLLNGGGPLLEALNARYQAGAIGVALDARELHSLISEQIGALIGAFKKLPADKKLALIVDPQSQGGLKRVLDLMKLDQVLMIFDSEEAVFEAWRD